jgi:tmRNA-binding protein
VQINESFFSGLHLEIKSILDDKNLRANLKTDFRKNELDSLVYVNILIKSIHFIEHINLDDQKKESMLHRTVVLKNIKKYGEHLSIQNASLNVVTNCFKVIMLLVEHVETKKLTTKRKNKIRSDIYIKFKLTHEASINERVVISYASGPYQSLTDSYQIGYSIASLRPFFKRSQAQFLVNKLNTQALTKLNSRQIYIDNFF